MDFQHITLSGVAGSISYKGSGRGNFKKFERTVEQRKLHGKALEREVLPLFPESPDPGYISEDEPGVYLEIVSVPGYPLKEDQLDNQDCRLCNLFQYEDESEQATVFVYDSKRKKFLNKLNRYSLQEGRNTSNDLFDNIASIRLARVEDFWTSSKYSFPSDGVEIWWEVWLSRRSLDRKEVQDFRVYCQRYNIVLSANQLNFELSTVLAVRASPEALSYSTALISCLSELRKITETASFLLQQNARDQAEWVDHILESVDFSEEPQASVLVLDDGVNFNHPLLATGVSEEDCFSWDPEWPLYDRVIAHGTHQAGLILYGDLLKVAIDGHQTITYDVESCRILPPEGGNDKELYGSLTYFAVNQAEDKLGEQNRVISLAVTASHEGKTGQPTSWSSEIDQLSFYGDNKRLFVLSAGNIRGEDVRAAYKENVLVHSIEDPGQSWNALTVGAYTEKVEISDHSFRGWSALSEFGDVCPTSRTSQSWDWKAEAPIKPDVVEEGGNLLLSPAGDEISNADCVSLVTTSDPSAGHLFSDHKETSAATALVSKTAATLWSKYPDYWSETIRALIVHSADWTSMMLSYRDRAMDSGFRPRSAKELMLRVFGHGVPSIAKAVASSERYLTMVVEERLKPYLLKNGDLQFDEMHLIELPWPQDELLELGNSPVKLRITLSYYVEPNPGRRGYSQRFRYQSYGLRFKLINANEDLDAFIMRANVGMRDETYDKHGADSEGWSLGDHLRTRGTLHQDTWEGPASQLAIRNKIAIIPVAGWWKQRQTNLNTPKSQDLVPYSLVVSLDVQDGETDIYTPVAQQVGIDIPIEV